MSTATFPYGRTLEVRDACLCLHVQRAARALARRFDDALRPVGLTHGQFSLLMSLNRPEPPSVGELAPFLAMDRTTLTAMLKPLERRGLVRVAADEKDRRRRRLALTPAGHALLGAAYPVWKKAHGALEGAIADPDGLRAALSGLGSVREAAGAGGTPARRRRPPAATPGAPPPARAARARR